MYKKIIISILLAIFAFNLDAMNQEELNKALRNAIKKDKIEEVKELIKKGASVTAQYNDDFCWTPIHWAAYQGNVAIIQLLLDNDADINAKNKYCTTCLHCAAYMGHSGVVKFLIEKGAQVNVKKGDGDTPLHRAAFFAQKDVVEILLYCGANKYIRNNQDRTASDIAKTQEIKDFINDGIYISIK